jgi:hypothetical protein
MSEFEAFAEELREKLDKLSDDFDTVRETTSDRKNNLSGDLESLVGDVTSGIATKFTDEVMSQLTDSAGGLTDALSVLDDAGGEAGELLDGSIGEIVDSVSGVTDLIEEVKPVLDMVQDILG